jgi:hypothetical protein
MAEEVKTEIVSEGMILDILKKIEKSEEVKIVQFSTGSSSERGENWSSTMIRFEKIGLFYFSWDQFNSSPSLYNGIFVSL